MVCHTRLRIMACRVMSCIAVCRSMCVNVDGLQVHGVPCRAVSCDLCYRCLSCLILLSCIESMPCRAVSFSLPVACQQGPGTSLVQQIFECRFWDQVQNLDEF